MTNGKIEDFCYDFLLIALILSILMSFQFIDITLNKRSINLNKYLTVCHKQNYEYMLL